MPRHRNLENLELPQRWRFTHGAYYYQVPPGMEAHWDNKKTFRLDSQFNRAFREYERRIASQNTSKNVTTDKTLLLELGDILTMGKMIPVSGVYFLMLKGELVYVGRSNNILTRLANHRSNHFVFDHFHSVEAVGAEQVRLEKFYILKFKPRFNITHC